jgi:xanthine phosphoribosyltransferase
MSWIRKWKKSKKKYTWNYIERACKDMSYQMDELGITHVIGLSRGGLVPATIIANNLGVRKLYSIGIASYEMGYDGVESVAGDLSIYQQIPVNASELDKDAVVAVVDDISDKGNTLNYITQNILSNYNCKYVTSCVFVKPGTAHIPDIKYKFVPEDQWVIFPWEI